MAVEPIQYRAGNVTGNGALIWNEKVEGRRPLLLVMTNWLGVTETAIKRAAKMASDEYVAFVGDMCGNGRTSSGPPEAQELMMAVRADRLEGRNRGLAALENLVADAEKHGIGDTTCKPRSAFASAAATCSNSRAPAPTSMPSSAFMAIPQPPCRRRRATSKRQSS